MADGGVAGWELSALANVPLSMCLFVLALLAGRQGSVAARLFGVYLALVSMNYAVDAVAGAFRWLDVPYRVYLASLPNLLDPGVLLLSALALSRGRPLGKAWWLLAPGGLLAVVFVWTAGAPGAWFTLVYTLMVVTAYVAALLLVTAAAFREGHDRPGLTVMATALAPVALTRLPLAYVDLGFGRGPMRSDPRTLLMELLLVLAAVGFVLFCRKAAGPAGRARAHALSRSVLSILLVVEVVWALRFVPRFMIPAFALLYSVRWFLFLAVVASQARRGLAVVFPVEAARPLRATVVALAAASGAAMAASLVSAAVDSAFLPSLLLGAAVVAVGLGTLRALRTATVTWDVATESREGSVYRAHVLLGTSAVELEDLRRRLGLDRAHAARIGEIAALELAASRASSDGLAPGALLSGTYRVERPIGAGSFGRVFAATDVTTGAPVILKELRDEWRSDPLALARFRNEIEILTSIRHPNLVRFRAIEPVRGGNVLVLERVEGETLRERLVRQPLAPAEARRLAEDVLDALAVLHARGIVHRDVKPSNVVLAPDGRAVLLDLGSATPPGSGTILGAPAGAGPGTPEYMSPEQRRGGAVDGRSDLYALGIVIGEALGRPPEAWTRVLRGATDPDPARRFPDARAFREALPR